MNWITEKEMIDKIKKKGIKLHLATIWTLLFVVMFIVSIYRLINQLNQLGP